MIQITIKAASGDMTIEAKGHALYNPGNDIVCAAVSAILQTAALGLQAVADNYPEHVTFDTV